MIGHGAVNVAETVRARDVCHGVASSLRTLRGKQRSRDYPIDLVSSSCHFLESFVPGVSQPRAVMPVATVRRRLSQLESKLFK